MASYAQAVPSLNLMGRSDTHMNEFGYRYEDRDIGTFFSRLSPKQLQRQDSERAAEAAAALDKHRSPGTYRRLLEKYTPYTDPFIHEAGVHLFRRDRYLQLARAPNQNKATIREKAFVAYRENLILEKYFSATLQRSKRKLSLAQRRLLAANDQPSRHYRSRVSEGLMTIITEQQVRWSMVLIILILVGTDVFIKRRDQTNRSKRA